MLLAAAHVTLKPDLFIGKGVGCDGSGSHVSVAGALGAFRVEVHLWSALFRGDNRSSVIVPGTLLRFGGRDQNPDDGGAAASAAAAALPGRGR